MSLLVVGSVAIDSVETPGGRADDVVGGAALYFSLAASFFAPVRMVGVVGADFPRPVLDDLRRRGIDLEGLEEQGGRTFRWSGRYHEDVNVRDTLHLDLGVFAEFRPTLPDRYRDSRYVFLANIDPVLQAAVLEQLDAPAVVGCDTMNHWIAESRPALEQLLPRVDMLVINDEEARLLSGERNIVRSAARILKMGPDAVLIKRGSTASFSSPAIRCSPCRHSRSKKSPIPPARAIASPAASWASWRAPATPRLPGCVAPSCTGASWARSWWRTSARAGCCSSPLTISSGATASSSA